MDLPMPYKDPPKPGVSSSVRGGLGLLITATVDMLVAFSTAYWATWNNSSQGEYGGYGLWKMWHCAAGTGNTDSKDEVLEIKLGCEERMADSSYPAWYVATQVLETLGLAGLLAALVMLFLYIYLPQWERNKTAISSIIAVSYLSGLFIMVGLFVFGFKVVEEIQHSTQEWLLSWSFSMACIAFVLTQIAASILIAESKRLHHIEEMNKKPKEMTMSEQLHSVLYAS